MDLLYHIPNASALSRSGIDSDVEVGCLRILSNLSPHHFLDLPHDCLPSGNDAVAVFLHEGVHLFFRIGVVF